MFSTEAIITILGMALVTYATRVGGLLIMDRITLSKRVMAWLRQIPGAVLIAIIAPDILKGGPQQIAAGIVTIMVMRFTNSLLAALLSGVGFIWLLRTLFGM